MCGVCTGGSVHSGCTPAADPRCRSGAPRSPPVLNHACAVALPRYRKMSQKNTTPLPEPKPGVASRQMESLPVAVPGTSSHSTQNPWVRSRSRPRADLRGGVSRQSKTASCGGRRSRVPPREWRHTHAIVNRGCATTRPSSSHGPVKGGALQVAAPRAPHALRKEGPLRGARV